MPSFHLETCDATAGLTRLPDQSIHLLCTDGPYASLDKHRAVGTTTRLKQKWFPTVPNEYWDEWFRQAHRILAKNAHLYFFCDSETMFDVKPRGEAAGFTFWKPIVWDKQRMGMGYHYRASCEFILFFEKGKRRLNDLGIKDVLSEPRIKTDYPTEKPVPLLETLVRQSTFGGETVLDTFFGSGSCGEASLRHGRHFLGFDVDPESLPPAQQRLSQFGELT